MRVLHVSTDGNIGGAGRHLLTLLDAYDRGDFVMEVALPAGSRLIPELEARDVPYFEVPDIEGRSFSIKGFVALHRLIKETRPDVIHTHASLAGRLAARVCGLAIVHTRHSVFPPSGAAASAVGKFFLGQVNNRLSDAIIAVSPAAKENLELIGTDPERISVLYNGITPLKAYSDNDKRIFRASFGIPGSAFVVSHIARLVDEKGHDYTLDAAKIWMQEAPDILVLIAGDGPREAFLQWRIRSETISNVVLSGFVEEIEKVVNISDLQINASYGTEATSLALLEGMSLGVPAVVSDFGGNPYVIKDGESGLVVPKRDAKALASAVMRVKEDAELYKRLSEGAAAEFESRFRAEDMARYTEDVYRKVKGGSNVI